MTKRTHTGSYNTVVSCETKMLIYVQSVRFHIDLDHFLKSSREWYDIKFLRGKNRTKSISYEAHKTAYEAVLVALV
ncbi:hypothetical protein PHMEG_00036064 [Phytophthora megakarya]|uniref:Uncharacterized protein n=1 Tax=Phytophthora megakarya TaxID=4795 RepID=A0A225ULZ2_9STRA|nr:hypothetical protein PHMEG_00036064 [Phytophthora megakarya]